jgi:molecular chaperone DnaK
VDVNVLQGEREMAHDNRSLGKFRLDGIPPASRGTPQIEVTFDIDANGILNVSAKDKATGKEQKITISGSSNLSKEELDRMMDEAKTHSAEDKKRREEAEVRNNADSLAYQVEKQLSQFGSSIPVHEKARIDQLVTDLRQALKENTDIGRIRTLSSDLQQASYSLSEAAYKKEQTVGRSETPPKGGDDDVIDAEFEEK